MDDILASIRRILNEEEAKPGDASAGDVPGEDADDVLQLDEAMLVADEGPVPVEPPSMGQAVIAVPQVPEPLQPLPLPLPPAPLPPVPVPRIAELAVPMPALAVPFAAPTLLAPEAAASAAASVGALMRTLATERSTAVHRGGPTLEDLVREEMRPLVKEWLDSHLAPMVERLVRAEIERVVGRMA